MCFKKDKFKKLKREDVVEALLKLQDQEAKIEDGLSSKQQEINALLEKGKKEADKSMKLYYAKKINALKADKDASVQRGLMLLYNIRLLEKLKIAVEDKSFVADIGGVPLNQLLGDQKALAKFLNGALNNKIKLEDMMTGADQTFNEVEAAYSPNEEIYGAGQKDDDLLAMFETAEGIDDTDTAARIDAEKQKKDKDRTV